MPIRKLYDWTMKRAATKQAEGTMAAIAFAESSFFPVPPDIMLIPMMIARPERAYYLAAMATIASVVGGLLGYAIGYFLKDTVGEWIIATYHMEDAFERFQQGFKEWGAWIIILKGLTPIPYKLVTIASGIAQYPILPFIGASIIARGGRFFLLAVLLRTFGEKARHFIEKHMMLAMLGLAAIVVLGFVVVLGV